MMAAHPDTPPLGSHASWQGYSNPRVSHGVDANGQPFLSPLFNQMDPAYQQANPYSTVHGTERFEAAADGKLRPGSYQQPAELGLTTPHPDREVKRPGNSPNAPVEMEG